MVKFDKENIFHKAYRDLNISLLKEFGKCLLFGAVVGFTVWSIFQMAAVFA